MRLRLGGAVSNVAAMGGAAPSGIGTPVAAGKATSANGISATPSASSTVAVAVGDMVYMAIKSGSSNAPTAVNFDGEAMTAGALVTSGSNRLRLFWLRATAAHASNVSATATFGNANGTKLLLMAHVSGLAASPLDAESAAGTSGNSTSPSITTVTLAQAAELIICPLFWMTAVALTDDPAFTQIDQVDLGGNSLGLAFKKTASTAAVTYAPSLASASDWMTTYAAFKGA